ncbi:hypothetical protein BC830DRAFT_1094389 [Chytriomyces sp. MP71]|nr:hypothetical protein BC830DRAFT_1094389 [Chytriomyces sp. MP71]
MFATILGLWSKAPPIESPVPKYRFHGYEKPTLETLPSEIIDRIFGYLDGPTMVQLSHAMPRAKEVSASMFLVSSTYFQQRFDAGARFNSWPSLCLRRALPSHQDSHSHSLSPNTVQAAVADHLNLVRRCGGRVTLQPDSEETLVAFLAVLPTHSNAYVALNLLIPSSWDHAARALHRIAQAKLFVSELFFGNLKGEAESEHAQSLMALNSLRCVIDRSGIPSTIWEALQRVRGLQVLDINNCYACPVETLPAIPELQLVSFRNILFAGSFNHPWFTRLISVLSSILAREIRFQLGFVQGPGVDRLSSFLDSHSRLLDAAGWKQTGLYWSSTIVWKRMK